MPFEIGFQGSTNSGSAKTFKAGVARAVARVGASHDPAAEAVTLEDGAVLHLGLDPGALLAAVVAEDCTPALNSFVYALADETAAIIQTMHLTVGTPSVGLPPPLLPGLEIWRIESEDDLFDELQKAFQDDAMVDNAAAERENAEAERKAAFEKALAERRAELAAGRTRSAPLVSGSGRSIFQRLSDALFGKAI